MQRVHKIFESLGCVACNIFFCLEMHHKCFELVEQPVSVWNKFVVTTTTIEKIIYLFALCHLAVLVFTTNVWNVHNDLTPIPWWLPTYFSSLPAMNFNEFRFLCQMFVMWYFGFGFYTLSWQNDFAGRHVCWLRQRRKKKSTDKTAELRTSQNLNSCG